MKHQIHKKKFNRDSAHRTALIRNQAISLILHGKLTSTKARAKEVRRFTEKLVTIARKGDTFHMRRRVEMQLPYHKEAIDVLFKTIAPQYTERPGGYTRILLLGRRVSDTADMARLEWV